MLSILLDEWNTRAQWASLLGMVCALVLPGFFIYLNIRPRKSRVPSKKIGAVLGGAELLYSASVCAILQVAVWVLLAVYGRPDAFFWIVAVLNFLAVFLCLILNGMIRVAIASTQLGIVLKILLLSLWFIPIVNVVLAIVVARVAMNEYQHEYRRYTRNQARKSEQVCKTQYPVLMVHGIFFRDWKVFNYWGRIPVELAENGVAGYFGRQQSSAAVEQSGAELAQRIEEVLAETGSEKVNIIAHSKGGLDARYAISRLGMADKVASLTTVSTPHHGCTFAGRALEKAPDALKGFLQKNYARLFKKLGDDSPDFFAGVQELTVEKCAQLNAEMPDVPGVYYQSVGSKMKTAGSAPFPLNVGYQIVKAMDGDNDGLVFAESMPWGNFLGVLTAPGKKGISHGDMIDLTRKNIKGFDVCEYYVGLVAGLKNRGL